MEAPLSRADNMRRAQAIQAARRRERTECPCHGLPWYEYAGRRQCIVSKRAGRNAWRNTPEGRERHNADARQRQAADYPKIRRRRLLKERQLIVERLEHGTES